MEIQRLTSMPVNAVQLSLVFRRPAVYDSFHKGRADNEIIRGAPLAISNAATVSMPV